VINKTIGRDYQSLQLLTSKVIKNKEDFKVIEIKKN